MNDNEHNPILLRGADIALDKLADVLLNEVADDLEVLEILQGLMPPLMFQALCAKLEVCEVHICDVHICEDDEADCPAGAEAKLRNQQNSSGHMLIEGQIEEWDG